MRFFRGHQEYDRGIVSLRYSGCGGNPVKHPSIGITAHKFIAPPLFTHQAETEFVNSTVGVGGVHKNRIVKDIVYKGVNHLVPDLFTGKTSAVDIGPEGMMQAVADIVHKLFLFIVKVLLQGLVFKVTLREGIDPDI